MLRHYLTVDLPLASQPLPWPTFVVNVSGCLLIGILTALLAGSRTPSPRLFLVTGLLGGFTTFSHFVDGVREMVSGGDVLQAAIYSILTLVCGLAAVWIGTVATQRLKPARPPPKT